jgi:hypothetical protein
MDICGVHELAHAQERSDWILGLNVGKASKSHPRMLRMRQQQAAGLQIDRRRSISLLQVTPASLKLWLLPELCFSTPEPYFAL